MVEEEEKGVCGCGAEAEYYGPDPYAEAMCGVHGCDGPECGCRVCLWMCEDCEAYSVECI